MPLTIRPAQTEDLESILPLLHSLWPDHTPDDATCRQVLRGMVEGEDHLQLVAVDGEALVGFCTASVRLNLYYGGKLAFITSMVVHENQRGKGTGSKLLGALIQAAREAGCTAIELDSAFKREKAHAFYEKHGFEKSGYCFGLAL